MMGYKGKGREMFKLSTVEHTTLVLSLQVLGNFLHHLYPSSHYMIIQCHHRKKEAR